MAQYWASSRPFDMRHVESPVFLSADGEHVAHQAVWLKAIGDLPDDPALHRAALAYASDYTILEPTFRRHGIAWAAPGLKAASLDHAMWWHRPVRVDEWLLYVQESPSAAAAAGSRSAGSSPGTASSSPPWPRRAWSASAPRLTRGLRARPLSGAR